MTWFTYSKILLCTVSCRNYFLSAVYIRQPERGLRVAEITAQLTNVYILSKCGPGGVGAVAALGDILCSPRAWQENNGLFVSHWWYSTTEQARNQSLEIIEIQNVCIFKKVFFLTITCWCGHQMCESPVPSIWLKLLAVENQKMNPRRIDADFVST